MIISAESESVRYTGRWFAGQKAQMPANDGFVEVVSAQTTAPGAYFELAFEGRECTLMFDMNMNIEPRLHIYIELDGVGRIECAIDDFIRVEAAKAGNHVIRVIYKSSMEAQPRWQLPLISKITFIGAEADAQGKLPCDNRDIIEFIGDSITEGVWSNEYGQVPRTPYNARQKNMVYLNDATATYAYLTAEALDMRPVIMGYGSVGITRAGHGGVPKVYDAYPYCYEDAPMQPTGAKIIVINHGANDREATEAEYISGYEKFLKLVRKINPKAKIVSLSAFFGVHEEALGKLIEKYNKENDDDVYFIGAGDWIPKEPVHPARAGHQIVSEKLAKILKEII